MHLLTLVLKHFSDLKKCKPKVHQMIKLTRPQRESLYKIYQRKLNDNRPASLYAPTAQMHELPFFPSYCAMWLALSDDQVRWHGIEKDGYNHS